MKTPKQQTGGPLGFLNFFGRKPKSDARPEKPGEARPVEEAAVALALARRPRRDRQTAEASAQRRPSGAERGDGGVAPAEDGAAACPPARTGGAADVPAPSRSGRDRLADEHLEECPLCLLRQPRCRFPRLLTCPHRTCGDCLRRYLRIEISESRVGIACPQCPEALAPLDVRAILDDPALLERFEEYQLRRFLAADPDTRWCPAPDCGYAVIAYGCAECPKLRCGRDGCDTDFCYHCRQLWHPDQTCDQARRQRARHALGGKDALYVFSEDPGGDAEEIKPCPRCGAHIMKTNDGSCNRMNCTVCACQFCWLCMQEITDVHYLSPSGCTFWGKKPWSQSRKVLWQVGMLLGAPVVISLIAGLAVPVIIVGIPIYMGRKVHGRCKKNNISGSKHYLTVASGVMMSVFVSPVIAAVAVGVGVPLMLTYVYGVVPMSLCRNGWCRPPADAPDTLEDLASSLYVWCAKKSKAHVLAAPGRPPRRAGRTRPRHAHATGSTPAAGGGARRHLLASGGATTGSAGSTGERDTATPRQRPGERAGRLALLARSGYRLPGRRAMDALKNAGRAIVKSPGVPRHTWGTSRHRKLAENWTDTKETLLEGMAFHVKYLGMTLVGQPKGEDMAAAAIRRIVATARAGAKKFRKVTLTVSPKGIVITDTDTTDLVEDVSIYRISYCTADKNQDKVFAYVSQSPFNETLECHAFLCQKKKIAQAVTLTVAQAFKVALDLWELAQQDKSKKARSTRRSCAAGSDGHTGATDGECVPADASAGVDENLCRPIPSVSAGSPSPRADPARRRPFKHDSRNGGVGLLSGLCRCRFESRRDPRHDI
ncbi:E3 ubiquitin-protein ligase RNF19B isoform X2 [Phyllopteryx taeniolatus]|uniref:E3 ubiquitin-protein ligase RNF19B isoform X2 n=1 Tax=Phyllopteryx taeniolatus TaxID=161469 RepID=UPI002AD1F9D4|nr:E3 ubiquitin-protein ligase RNF19B isoform X2 [Phyllopteryx taeniolatus]